MILIETERLVIRNFCVNDAEIIFDYRNNPVCSRFQRGQIKDLLEIKKLIRSHASDEISCKTSFMAAIALKDDDILVGEICVMPTDGTFSLGYTISYKHQRKGYAYEALKALMEKLHAIYHDFDFVCFTDKENFPSKMLLKKLGYIYLGYLETKNSDVFAKYISEETRQEIERACARRIN